MKKKKLNSFWSEIKKLHPYNEDERTPKWTFWNVFDLINIIIGYLYLICMPIAFQFLKASVTRSLLIFFGSVAAGRLLAYALEGYTGGKRKLAYLKGKVKAREELEPVFENFRNNMQDLQKELAMRGKIAPELKEKQSTAFETLKRFMGIRNTP